MHHHLALGAFNIDVGKNPFPAGIQVEHLVRHQLVVPDHFSGLWLQRKHRGGVEIVTRAPARIPWPGVATPQYTRSRSGSYEPVTQVEPPARRYASPAGQV